MGLSEPASVVEAASPSRPRPAYWLELLTLPLLAHTFLVSSVAWRTPFESLDWIDFGVLGASLAVVLALVLCARSRSRWARLLLVVYSLLIAVGIGEIAARAFFPPPPPEVPWPPMKLRRTAADTMVGISGPIEFTVNSLGIRGPEVELDQVDAAILCVGGSTTLCFYVDDEESWPWLTGARISECVDRRVYVGNAGKSAHTVAQNEYLLRHYARAREFDWVVVLAGFNDASSAISGSLELPKRRMRGTLTPAREPLAWPRYYRRLALVELVANVTRKKPSGGTYQEDLTGEWYREVRRDRQAALAKRTIHEPPPDLPRLLDHYRAELRKLIATTREFGQQVVFMTQPTPFGEHVPEEIAARFMTFHSPEAGYSPAAYAKIMDAYNAALLEVCREEQVDCVDLAARLPKDESVFYDDNHFNVSGCAQVAEALSEFFCAKLARGEEGREAR
ncbi:MAG: GDSL-type esterase/lipase family protein [Planctomycetales bacterium]